MVKRANPFLVEGYLNDEYFCDRAAESMTMLKALESRRNMTLISLRRMGKSGLIHHVFAKVNREHSEIATFYIDLFHTHSLRDFINEFAAAVFGHLDSPIEKIYKTITQAFKKCRPMIVPDAITGAPTLSFDFDKGEENHTLREIFDYLRNSNRQIYIALDEFQQIGEYPEKGTEALLRSLTQITQNVSFVFAGSKKHLMQEMFSLPSRPFYQSTQTLYLQAIDRKTYYEFASRHLAKFHRRLEADAFDYIYDTVFGHTWYVQYWLSRIFDFEIQTIDIEQTKLVLNSILSEEDATYYTYTRLMTATQLRTARGIAQARLLQEPYSAENAQRYDLPPSSTLRSTLKSLQDKEIIVEERDTYSVYNRFFMLWLSHHGA